MSKIDFNIADTIDWSAEVALPDRERDGVARAQLRALRKAELAIARDFYSAARWPYVVVALAGFAIWLALFPLTSRHLINPGVACVIATLIAIIGYTTGHEAMHGNLSRKLGKSSDRLPVPGDVALNETIGWLSLIPIAIPLSVARLTHAAHHAHCNDPERDPDFCDHAADGWSALVKTWYNRQPGVQGVNYHYRRVLNAIGTPAAGAAQRHALIYHLAFVAILAILAWTGHAVTAALVWWLPRQLALSYIRFMFSWAPHHPRSRSAGRYGNTRVFRSPFGHLLTMGMQYHLIHHLYPNILIHKNKRAFDALRHILEARGVDCSALPPERAATVR